MNNAEEREELRKRFLDENFMLGAVQNAVRNALMEHERAGNPVAEWRDGKVIIVPP
jgi:hypothetical protein